MEGHEGVPVATLVVHVVALLDGDAVELDRAALLRGHQDLGRDDLACGTLGGGTEKNINMICLCEGRT